MKYSSNYELQFEVEGVVEKLEGKRMFTISTQKRSADMFIETERDTLNLTIILLSKWLILIGKGRKHVTGWGVNILHRVCVTAGDVTLFLDDCPVKISSACTLPSSGKYSSDKILLSAATIFLVLSISLTFLPEKGVRWKYDREVTMSPVTGEPIKFPLKTERVPLSNVKEVLLNLEITDDRDLERILEKLYLSRTLFKMKGNEKGLKFTGRAIGGINKYLKRKGEDVRPPLRK